MTTQDILQILQQDIHSTVFATVDDDSLPQTCVIDLMLADEEGLYFLTARGKSFYDRLMTRPFVALSGMKGADTLSTTAISVRSAVQNIGRERLRCSGSIGRRENISISPSFRPTARGSHLVVKKFIRLAIASMETNVSALRGAEAFVPKGASAAISLARSIRAIVSTAATASVSARQKPWSGWAAEPIAFRGRGSFCAS